MVDDEEQKKRISIENFKRFVDVSRLVTAKKP